MIEGAVNQDLNAGPIIALASNSAAWFRQTGVNPLQIAEGEQTYQNSLGQMKHLPDVNTLETAVDADLLAWPPGNFDSSGDLQKNPAQIPPSYT